MRSKMSLHMNKIIDISSRKCVKVENSIYSFVSGFREIGMKLCHLLSDCIG